MNDKLEDMDNTDLWWAMDINWSTAAAVINENSYLFTGPLPLSIVMVGCITVEVYETVLWNRIKLHTPHVKKTILINCV